RNVRTARSEGYEATIAEHGHDELHVVQVPRSLPWVVGDEYIAWRHRVDAQSLAEMANGARQRADERRETRRVLREQQSAIVRENAGIIVRLVQQHRERGAHDHLRSLVDDRC